MVGDRAAERQDRLRNCQLDLIPLLEFLAETAWRVDRAIRRGAVGIHVREAARDRAAAARLAHGLLHGSQHALVALPEAIPGDRRLEGLGHQPEPDLPAPGAGRTGIRGPRRNRLRHPGRHCPAQRRRPALDLGTAPAQTTLLQPTLYIHPFRNLAVGIAPCARRLRQPRKNASAGHGAGYGRLPADGYLHRLEIRVQTIQLSPYHADRAAPVPDA